MSTTLNYTVSVGNDIESLTVTPTANHPRATITVDGRDVASGSASQSIDLTEGGTTTITIEVRAQDGRAAETYTIAVSRAPSDIATLSSLTLTDRLGRTPVLVEPEPFAEDTFEYSARVQYTVSTLTVVVSATDNENAEIRVGGTEVLSGAEIDVGLAEAGSSTNIEIVVTAQDRTTTRTYAVTVDRAAMPAANDATLFNLELVANGEAIDFGFDSEMSTYTVGVAHTVGIVEVTPSANDPVNARIEVNGDSILSSSPTNVMLAAAGQDTEIVIIVTAATGTTASYTVTVSRELSNDATLTTLVLTDTNGNMIELSPDFASMVTNYSASVSETIAEVRVTPVATEGTMSVIMVNDNPVAISTSINVQLRSTGTDTRIEIIVTAPNRTTTNSYTVTVSRAPSTNANLADLTVSAGILSPTFNSDRRGYTVEVANATATITVTPTARHPSAAITVDGRDVASSSASDAITLTEGAVTTIMVVVTAQDGETMVHYTIAVNRAPSSDASLSDLAVSAGTLSPAFNSTTLNYTVSVASATTMTTVTPTANHPRATITVETAEVETQTLKSGTTSTAIALTAGEVTTITVVVTAQDSTTNTYTIAVNRPLSSDASLSALEVSAGTLSPAFNSTTLSYTVSVASATTMTTVTPTANHPDATIKVDGRDVASGIASQSIPLTEGATTTIIILVTAADGTINTYRVVVERPPAGIRVRVKVFLEGPLR